MAKYRQTVLTAFRQVEDDLATPRILAHKAEQQETVVKSSQRYLTLAGTARMRISREVVNPRLFVIGFFDPCADVTPAGTAG